MSPALLLAAALISGTPQAQAVAEGAPPIDELKRAYEQSCGDRAYGSFDDVCTQMSDQIRQAERDRARAARHPSRPAASQAEPAAAPVALSAQGPPSR